MSCSVLFCSALLCSVLFYSCFVLFHRHCLSEDEQQDRRKKNLYEVDEEEDEEEKRWWWQKKSKLTLKCFGKNSLNSFLLFCHKVFLPHIENLVSFFFCFFSSLNFLSLSITYVFAWNNKKKENQEMNYMLSAKLYNWFFADHISLLFLHRLSVNRCFSASSVSSLNLFFLFMFFCKY